EQPAQTEKPTPTPAEEPAAAEPYPEDTRLAELQQRLPQKQLFLPPRQSERFALSTPAEPTEEPTIEEAPPPEEPAEEPEPPVVAEEEAEEPPAPLEPEPRVSLLGPQAPGEELPVELPMPSPLEPELPEAEATLPPAPLEEPLLVLEPEAPPLELPEEAPPAEIPGEVAAAAEPPQEGEPTAALETGEAPAARAEPSPVPLSAELAREAYYLQLGAYSSRSLAERLAGEIGEIGPNYEVSIQPAEHRNRTIYKVLIGPLNTDESGTLLYLFRARGFRDAFLRHVE
ncbi:MAG: SPOR domain-containing protein, partial [Spirochaetales bacterium]|nr:SPOR domain-containing protein [Spirochaetales bacterium]